MSGMAAIALCAVYTSCSNHEVFDAGRNQAAESATAAYKQAFINTIGKPAANQDWGFGTTRANRRSANPQGNMWEQDGWNVPPVITDAQKNIVRQYFQQNPNLSYTNPEWTNFWIQQVYKGGTNTEGSKTKEAYTIGNGDTVVGGDNMDHVASKDANGNVDHVNNFNNSDSNDWEGRMLMVESSTYSFGYNNSNGSVYHYDKAALVNWTVIRDWANANGLNGDVLDDGWNRSYMGFDWEQVVGDDVYAKGKWDEASSTWDGNADATFEFEGETYRLLKSEVNQYAYDESETTFGGKANYQDKPSDDIIRQLLALGYLPYTDTLKDWIKLATGADGYYSDWIVTLTEAKQNQNDADYSIRVIGEDLSASEQGDFDFNDVVFDVALNVDGKTQIKLQAAGGTLPLIIGVENPSDDQDYTANEVHNVFGGYDVTTMINTNAGKYGKSADGVAPAILVLDKAYGNAKDIPVYVKKNGAWVEFTAERGEPASKIGVSTDFQWVNEKEYIGAKYPNFVKWVTENTDNVSKWY